MILKTINYLLSIEIKIVPVLILYLICLFPTEFRKQARIKYTPIYCSLPILQHSRYLKGFYLKEIANTKEERVKLIRDNSISFGIEAMIIPTIFGVLFGFFKVPLDVKNPLIIFLTLTRIYQFIKCTWEIKKEKLLPNNLEIFKLMVLYTIFLYLYARNMNTAYEVGLKGIEHIVLSIIKFIKVLINTMIYSLVGAPIDFMSIKRNDFYNEDDNELELEFENEKE